MPVVGSVFGKPLDDDIYGLQNALAIIVSGDTAPSALSQGKYIYLINHSTIRSGLYRVISTIASGDTIVSTDIETVPDGIINDLIEADATKVDKTDIVNNLTTNDSTKVLSAAQGYALNSNITKNQVGNSVNIASYTSSYYTAPSDGYICVESGSTAGNAVVAYIYGATAASGKALTIALRTSENGSTYIPVYVRKGMKVIIEAVTGNSSIEFRPLE